MASTWQTSCKRYLPVRILGEALVGLHLVRHEGGALQEGVSSSSSSLSFRSCGSTPGAGSVGRVDREPAGNVKKAGSAHNP